MEVSYMVAGMTLNFLKTLEQNGQPCGGLVQDWEEIIRDASFTGDAKWTDYQKQYSGGLH